MPSPSGEALFARFAFPPNDLGHCGPPGAELLLSSGASGVGGAELRARAPRFDGAWPYLRLLADAAGVADPLDPEVVGAYWLGGELLDQVGPADLIRAAQEGFRAQPGVIERLAEVAGDDIGAGASHTFHVFVVYPWVGLLGAGSDVPRSVLDSCRVRWGTVESVDGDTAGVRSPPLEWDGAGLRLGADRLETLHWTRNNHALAGDLCPGESVALHWDWVCDRLTLAQVAELSARTQRQLAVTNAWLARRAQSPQKV